MIDINNIINAATPILTTIITGVLTWGIAKVNKLINAKVSTEQYTKLKNVGQNAWFIVEEYFRLHPEEKTSVEAKVIKFANEVRKKIPCVSDSELETLRQAIAGEINKNKDISSNTSTTVQDSPIETPQQITATVVKKYYTEDGIELKPVTSAQ